LRKIFLIWAIMFSMAFINFLYLPSADAARNESAVEPRLLMAEVAGYGHIELKPGVTQIFYSILTETLQKNFNVESRQLVANLGGEPITNAAQIFSAIHMDVIARGPFHNYDTSSNTLKDYANSIFGRQRKGSKTDKKNANQAYRLNTSIVPEIRKIGETYGVDYIFFCNLRDIEFWRRVSSTNLTVKNLEGKKVAIDLDYYLVEVKTGKVFAGQISDNRTRLNNGQIIKSYGNRYTVDDMLKFALTEQANKIEKNILDKGLKSFRAK